MEEVLTQLQEWLTGERVTAAVQSLVVLLIGWALARLVRSTFRRTVGSRLEAQHTMIVGKGLYWVVMGLTVVLALRHLGVDLSLFVGAAGILTLALGFASQTAASNLISGLFLVGERPFKVGDLVRVAGTEGEVTSIDLMSVKIRTFDNLLVRLPNETLLKSEITNLTRYPIRRVDLRVSVAYKEDLERVQQVLFEVADRHPLCLDEPKPVLFVLGFGESGIDLQFSVWSARASFLEMKNALHKEVKAAFDAAAIEIPFPHRSLYAGAATAPLPVRLVGEAVSDKDTEPQAQKDTEPQASQGEQ